jgi:hypothetical protein
MSVRVKDLVNSVPYFNRKPWLKTLHNAFTVFHSNSRSALELPPRKANHETFIRSAGSLELWTELGNGLELKILVTDRNRIRVRDWGSLTDCVRVKCLDLKELGSALDN